MNATRFIGCFLIAAAALGGACARRPVDCEQLKREGRAAVNNAPTVDGKVKALEAFARKAKAAGCME